RGSRFFYTENPYISERLEKLIPKSTVYTISNYYNQVFDMPECWKRDCVLPPFDGITFLTITASYPHKNLAIAIDIAKQMKQQHSNFMFRFVFTVKEKDLPPMPQDLKKHFVFIGKVDITECPFLYEQSNIMFMPTLLECFTATYPEAMRMKCPIITTDLEFARGLCKNAAYYYDALSAESATEALYKVATNKELQSKLIVAGIEQLKMYDTYEQRADKLIEIMEQLVGSNKKIDNHVHL
ncbi:MAG: glycosyltransferase, partial [Bacteroidaceae bacterium]